MIKCIYNNNLKNMPKIIVDRDLCEGYGICVSICPKVFQLDKNGKAEVISQDIDNPDCQRAMSSCPVQAISIKD